MKIKSLFLWNFRNYKETSIDFSPGINAICGDNAQGKTNLLEAIYLLITGRSFRRHHLQDLVYFNAPAFLVEALFEKNGIEQILRFYSDGKKRKIELNGNSLNTLSALFGILNGTLLAPEDNELIKGPPAFRRYFLDAQIAQSNPFFIHHLSRYQKAMQYRNALLKRKSTETIEVWEQEMATSATEIITIRRQILENLQTHGTVLQQALSGQHDLLTLNYKTSAPSDSSRIALYFVEKYKKGRKQELEKGTTLSGPHRDDLLLLIDSKEARYFASEGQQRSCVAALKFAEWSCINKQIGSTPIMSIDDIGISLDPSREKLLFSHLKQLGQVFLTSPRKFPQLGDEAHLIFIKKGSIHVQS